MTNWQLSAIKLKLTLLASCDEILYALQLCSSLIYACTLSHVIDICCMFYLVINVTFQSFITIVHANLVLLNLFSTRRLGILEIRMRATDPPPQKNLWDNLRRIFLYDRCLFCRPHNS